MKGIKRTGNKKGINIGCNQPTDATPLKKFERPPRPMQLQLLKVTNSRQTGRNTVTQTVITRSSTSTEKLELHN